MVVLTDRFTVYDTSPEFRKDANPTRWLVDQDRFQLPTVTVHVNRGLIYREDEHDPDRVVADLSKALELDPLFPGAYIYRAELYEEKGDVATAKSDYHQALAVPEKYSDGQWAHKKAREWLAELEGGK